MTREEWGAAIAALLAELHDDYQTSHWLSCHTPCGLAPVFPGDTVITRTVKPTKAVEVMRDTVTGVEPYFANTFKKIKIAEDDHVHVVAEGALDVAGTCTRCGKVIAT